MVERDERTRGLPTTAGGVGFRAAGQVGGVRMRILLIVLGATVVLLLAIQLTSRREGHRTAERVTPDDKVPSVAQRDYPSSSHPPQTFAGPREAPGQAAGANPVDPFGPESNLTPEQVTRLHVSKQMEKLQRSGPASGALSSDAFRTVESLKQLPAVAGAEFGDFRCFAEGCAVSVTSQSGPTAGRAIAESRQLMAWPGPTFVSGPLPLSSGHVQNVLVLHRSVGGRGSPSPTTQ